MTRTTEEAAAHRKKLARQQRYRDANRERIRERERAYRSGNWPEMKARMDQWVKDNPDKVKAAKQTHKARKKEMVVAKKLEGCVDCGVTDLVVIQLHAPNGHTIPGKCIGSGERYSIADLEIELALCVPLCANCHLRRHDADRRSPQ